MSMKRNTSGQFRRQRPNSLSQLGNSFFVMIRFIDVPFFSLFLRLLQLLQLLQRYSFSACSLLDNVCVQLDVYSILLLSPVDSCCLDCADMPFLESCPFKLTNNQCRLELTTALRSYPLALWVTVSIRGSPQESFPWIT